MRVCALTAPQLSGSKVGAIHGDGSYFARDAKYSHAYARTLPGGQKQMLMANVLVGRWAKSEEGAPCPPLLPGSQCDRYDSFVDDVDHPTIFVVPHSTQACPVYVITYRC